MKNYVVHYFLQTGKVKPHPKYPNNNIKNVRCILVPAKSPEEAIALFNENPRVKKLGCRAFKVSDVM